MISDEHLRSNPWNSFALKVLMETCRHSAPSGQALLVTLYVVSFGWSCSLCLFISCPWNAIDVLCRQCFVCLCKNEQGVKLPERESRRSQLPDSRTYRTCARML